MSKVEITPPQQKKLSQFKRTKTEKARKKSGVRKETKLMWLNNTRSKNHS